MLERRARENGAPLDNGFGFEFVAGLARGLHHVCEWRELDSDYFLHESGIPGGNIRLEEITASSRNSNNQIHEIRNPHPCVLEKNAEDFSITWRGTSSRRQRTPYAEPRLSYDFAVRATLRSNQRSILKFSGKRGLFHAANFCHFSCSRTDSPSIPSSSNPSRN